MVNKTEFGNIREARVEEEMRVSYLDYAMSVIVARALPDVRDGLKPVQRRILYAMNELGMRPNTAYKKSARLVGEVLGKFHPHGDASVYDAMVRMAQPFSMRLPLVDGQGNFGSVDNDPAAAMRYTEARLSSVADQMLANLDQDTVDFSDNFDGTLREPVVLPARLPNLLINGASGIAVGMATNIPPQNPTEICNAIIRLLEHPESTVEDLMRYVKGPDFPTGATIMGTDGIKDAYTTGHGSIIVRALAEIEDMGSSNRMRIVISELPYQVNKAALIEKMAHLVKDKRIEGISEIRDESDREGMRIVIELRSTSQPSVVLNNLYKYTAMQSTFSVNMLAIVAGTPRSLNLRQALQHFVDFRQVVVARRAEFDLKKAAQRAHILEGLKIALDNIDEVIELIRSSDDVESARKGLMANFFLDEPQAQAILDMQLRRFAALEREKIETEYDELKKTIQGLEELLADPGKIRDEVVKETRELKKKHGQKRRTKISLQAHDVSREDLEPHEQVVVTLSKGGYIKRIPAGTYRNQHRGGKGVSSMITRDDDPVRHILVVDTHDVLLFFTNKGRVLSLRAFELRPDTSRNTRGVPVVNVVALGAGEKVNTVLGVPALDREDAYVVLGTRRGSIKRMPLTAIRSIRKSGLIAMNLRPNDELVSVRLCGEDDDIIFVSEQGKSIRFPIAQVTPHQRGAGGIRGMDVRDKDVVVAMEVVVEGSKLLVISRKGFGKMTSFKHYRQQGRGGLGILTFKVTRRTGRVAAALVVDGGEDIYVVSEKAQVLRTSVSEISSLGRITQGVTVFKPQAGDSVSSIASVGQLDEANQDEKPKANRTNGKGNGRMPSKNGGKQ